MSLQNTPPLLKDALDLAAGTVTVIAWFDILNAVMTTLLTTATLVWVLWRMWDRHKFGPNIPQSGE